MVYGQQCMAVDGYLNVIGENNYLGYLVFLVQRYIMKLSKLFKIIKEVNNMKRLSVLTIGACILCGCSTSTQKADTTTTAKTTAQTTSVAKVTKSIDYDAILKGDFSSVAGKWRNKAGFEIEFDNKGIVTKGARILEFKTQNGILYAQIALEQGSGYALNFVPKGTVIPKEIFHDGTDPSDSNRDRLFGAQAQPSVKNFDPYYRVGE